MLILCRSITFQSKGQVAASIYTISSCSSFLEITNFLTCALNDNGMHIHCYWNSLYGDLHAAGRHGPEVAICHVPATCNHRSFIAKALKKYYN